MKRNQSNVNGMDQFNSDLNFYTKSHRRSALPVLSIQFKILVTRQHPPITSTPRAHRSSTCQTFYNPQQYTQPITHYILYTPSCIYIGSHPIISSRRSSVSRSNERARQQRGQRIGTKPIYMQALAATSPPRKSPDAYIARGNELTPFFPASRTARVIYTRVYVHRGSRTP